LAQYEIDDPTFAQDLEKSAVTVSIAARWLESKGYRVTIKPTLLRPDVHQMSRYSDNGDLEIIQRVEVKHRPNINFYDLGSFPYETAIVDVCHTWDKARPKPYAYLIFNADRTGFLIITRHSFKYWRKVEKFDRKKNRSRQFYVCPIEHCQFVQC
jgi:hypothetical protein